MQTLKRLFCFFAYAALAMTGSSVNAQTTVSVTAADGSQYTFTLPPDVEQTFSRYLETVKAQAVVTAAKQPGAKSPQVDSTTGELVQSIVFRFWRALAQRPEYQSDAMRAQSDAAKALAEQAAQTLDATERAVRQNARRVKSAK